MRNILDSLKKNRWVWIGAILFLILLLFIIFLFSNRNDGTNPIGRDGQGVSSAEEPDTLADSESPILPTATSAATLTPTPTIEGVGGTNPIGRDGSYSFTTPTPSSTPETTITPTPDTFENIPVGPAGIEASIPELISPNDISGFSQIHNTVIGLPSNLEPVHILSWVDGNELALGFAFRNNSSDSYLVDLAYTITPYDSSGSELTDLLNFTTPLAEWQYAVRDLKPGESIDFWQVVQLSGPVTSLDSIEINFAGEALPRFQTEALPLEILAPPVSYFEIYDINSSTYTRGDENLLQTEFALFNPNASSVGVSFQLTAFDTAGNVLVAIDTSFQHNLSLYDSSGNLIPNNQTIIPPRESISYVLTTFIAEPALLGAVDLAIVPRDLGYGAPYQPEKDNPAIEFYADTIEVSQDNTAVSVNAILQSTGDPICQDYRLNVYAIAFDESGNVVDSGSVTLNTESPGFDIVDFTIPFNTSENIDTVYLFKEVNRFDYFYESVYEPVDCLPLDGGANPIGRDSIPTDIPTEWGILTTEE
ncbi:MAG: hypothetical protein H6652_09780 [Ardenticatenaceae bacterium]|nr:hypothetical protein [Ardenticatenaceae bacterium]MCB8949668.1 hypothetical protein [Ardenticatenaceae bacterium]